MNLKPSSGPDAAIGFVDSLEVEALMSMHLSARARLSTDDSWLRSSRVWALAVVALTLVSWSPVGEGLCAADEAPSPQPAAAPAPRKEEERTPRAFPAGTKPADKRLEALKTLDGYFPLEVPPTLDAWKNRAELVKRQLLISLGLWPMPTRTPMNPVIHGSVDRGDYTVEKVYFESVPGFYVTGSLYRPKGRSGRLPGILFPHGHWENGRFHDAGRKAVREQIVVGGERFEVGGRSPLQSLCVQLARMGCVVFHYDMIGYADSTQIPFDVAHRFNERRRHMEGDDAWGFFTPQAELRLQSIMGLQTWNSIRVLDWFTELPDVDPAKIAVTGASGGGTQTFILGAIDPRPAFGFPAVMVSTAMQGGCTCENASLLRIDTGNIEFAAMFAPRPQGMTGANDWTVEIATKGFPELQGIYELFGVRDDVVVRPFNHFGHNYNYVSRSSMYAWMNQKLGLGLEEPVVEEDYQPLTIQEASVWDSEHPKPPSGEDFERSLLKALDEDSGRQLAAVNPTSEAQLAEYRRVVGGGLEVMIGHGLPEAGDVAYERKDKVDRGDYLEMPAVLRNKRHGSESPTVFLYPKEWKKKVVVWLSPKGKAGLFGNDGKPREEVAKLLADGAAVAGIDLLYQGEFLGPGEKHDKARRVEKDRNAACYTLGYNHPLLAQRVHDALTLVAFIRGDEHKAEQVELVAEKGAGHWGAVANALAGAAIDRAVIDTDGFRFAGLKDYYDVDFLPGAVKYGDLPAILALCAPRPLVLRGEKEVADIVRNAYSSAGAAGAVSLDTK